MSTKRGEPLPIGSKIHLVFKKGFYEEAERYKDLLVAMGYPTTLNWRKIGCDYTWGRHIEKLWGYDLKGYLELLETDVVIAFGDTKIKDSTDDNILVALGIGIGLNKRCFTVGPVNFIGDAIRIEWFDELYEVLAVLARKV